MVGVTSVGTAQVNPLCGKPGDYGVYVSVMSNRAFFDSIISSTSPPSPLQICSEASALIPAIVTMLLLLLFC